VKLYYATRTRATRPRWALEELGVPYELVRIDMAARQHKSAEYMAIHPLGKLPSFADDDGTVLIESAAIAMHVADRFPERGLAPAPGTADRGRYYQWLAFGAATLDPPLFKVFYGKTFRANDPNSPLDIETNLPLVNVALDVLEGALTGREFLVGDHLTVADIIVGASLVAASRIDLLAERPALRAYVERLMARPAYVRANAD
jgi:glutathione S-transferase